MSSLDKTFEDVIATIGNPESLNPAKSDPVLYFVYPPEQMLEVKRSLPRWSSKLRDAGYQVERISFRTLLWEIIDNSGRWESWLEVESEADPEQINESIKDVVRSGNRLVNLVGDRLNAAPDDAVVLLTDTEVLHPYFRTRTIESALHDKVKIPTVIFYPGRRSGQYGLHFLDFYPVDGNYRSTLVGGD